jgi:hypothetical protein
MIDGTETGPRTVDIGNWSGRAIYSARGTIQDILKRDEMSNPGVYCLKYMPENDVYSERVYIGESESLEKRLKTHLSKPDKNDFIEFIGFFSKDELLTKSHVRYLESRLINLAKSANSAEVDNINDSEAFLSEADKSDMEFFLDQIKLILPVMGFRFLISDVVLSKDSSREKSSSKTTIYFIRSKTIYASMVESERGFVVQKGSQAKKDHTQSIGRGYVRLKERLIETKQLVLEGKYYVFKENTVFDSTTAASSVVLGRKAPGPINWYDEKKRSYKSIQENKFGKE